MNGRKEGNELNFDEMKKILICWEGDQFFSVFSFFLKRMNDRNRFCMRCFYSLFYILLFFLLLFSDFHFFVIKIHKFSLSLSNLSIKIFLTTTTTTHHHHHQSIIICNIFLLNISTWRVGGWWWWWWWWWEEGV